MTKEQLQKIRDALAAAANAKLLFYEMDEAFRILDAELAVPEQEPMYFGLTHDHTWLSVTPSCYKKLKPDMRMKVYTAPPNHYDQTALELCEVCGWKTLIPGDCCLNCERGKVEQEPVATDCTRIMREQGKPYPRTCPRCGFGPCVYSSTIVIAAPAPAAQPVSMETVYDTIIEWSTAGKGSRRELARRMIALFAAPQRECETCARKRERLLKAGFLKSPLRTKNEEKPLDESARCKECGSFACGGECVRRYEHG